MESLIFAVIAVRHLYKREKAVSPRHRPFQPLDLLVASACLQGRRDRSTNRSADRNDSHLAQAVS